MRRPILLPVLALLCLSVLSAPGQRALAVRHRLYVGTITRISQSALTIHSTTHSAYYTFQLTGSTQFLRKGQKVSRGAFKVGTYVTVSYSSGAHGSLIAYHVSLRARPAKS